MKKDFHFSLSSFFLGFRLSFNLLKLSKYDMQINKKWTPMPKQKIKEVQNQKD